MKDKKSFFLTRIFLYSKDFLEKYQKKDLKEKNLNAQKERDQKRKPNNNKDEKQINQQKIYNSFKDTFSICKMNFLHTFYIFLL